MKLGLDIGGTKTQAVLVDDNNTIATRVRVETRSGEAELIAMIVRLVERLLQESPAAVESLGIGIPGVVDSRSGHVIHAVNLDVADLALAEVIQRATGLPVRVENDVKAAALGAWHVVNVTGSLAYLNLGTGVAAGIVVDGTLWRGSRGGSGEIGHLTLDATGLPCRCGQRGCIETVASGGGIAQWWAARTSIPALDLFDRADAGEATAMAARSHVAIGVATAVRILALTVDVTTIVLGGGLSQLGERLLGPVREVLREAEASSPFLASLALAERIRIVTPDPGIAALGAALVGQR